MTVANSDGLQPPELWYNFSFWFSSQETHVIHTFKEDFYGEILSVVLVGYIRPETSFPSLGKSWL